MMTRKHYKAIASIIKDNGTSNCIDTYKKQLINDLINLFKLDNTRFNKARFIDACK